MRRGGENTQKNYTKKKNPSYPGNHDGVITDLEADILECKVKWALGSITMNKASGGDGIPAELYQILKDDSVKVLHSICQQIGKLSSGHRTGKGQFSFQIKKRQFQRIARREKKAFLSDQCKEIEENNRMGNSRDLCKKIRDIKGTFHAKMGTIKDRNGMDLTEAEDIKKRW